MVYCILFFNDEYVLQREIDVYSYVLEQSMKNLY